MAKETITAEKAPAAVGPYVHAVKAGGFVFTSGQLGLDPETGTLPEGVAAQAEQAIRNIETVLAAAGLALSDVVKTTVFLADMKDFAVINEVYARSFADGAPARACGEAAALPQGGLFEIEVVAALR